VSSLVVALGIGESFARERRRSGGRSSGARAKRAKELTTTDRPLAFRFHRRHLPWSLSSAANRASPDSSYCVFLCRSSGSANYLDEHATDGSYSTVEIGRVGTLQIGEEAADPRREMLFEHSRSAPEGAAKRRLASPAMISQRIAAWSSGSACPGLRFPSLPRSARRRAQCRKIPPAASEGQ
jgi:hypothetical protein